MGERRALAPARAGPPPEARPGADRQPGLPGGRDAADIRARPGLADEIGDVSLQLPALFGLWAGHHIAGTGSADLARRYAALAETQSESRAAPRRPAHARPGALLRGPLPGVARARRGRRSQPTTRSRIAISPIASATTRAPPRPNYKAWNLWHLGFPDQAAATIEDNLRWIREVDHANTTGLVLCFGTMTNIWLRQPDRVEAAAREALRLAEEMTLPLWHAWASIHLGWALSQQGAAPGLDEIEAGLREARQIGAGRFEPFHLGLAAEAYSRAGRHDEARAKMACSVRGPGAAATTASPPISTASGRAVAARRRDRACRGRGGPSPGPGDRTPAGVALAATARRAQPRSAVGRAGRAAAGRDLLAPVYGWFSEGFDTGPDRGQGAAGGVGRLR